MFSRNRFYLFLATRRADLWRQRGRVLERVASLSPTDPDFASGLRQAFVTHNSRRVGLLLNLPDLTVQTELTPVVGLFDRRKLVAKRLDYLFPRAALKGARIGKLKTQLAALRSHPALTATLQAIVGTGVELDWIAHAALEAVRLIPAALQASPYICVLNLGETGLLLAGEQNMLLAVRHLPLSQLDTATLASEIQSTFSYLQRHGWQQARDLAFIGFGAGLPSVPGLAFTRSALYPETDGYAELLAQLVQARKPLQPLTQPRLQRRKRVQTLQRGLTAAGMLAAILVIGCFFACWQLFLRIEAQDRALTEAMATLPPPLAIQDLPLLGRMQHALDAPLLLAAALPDDRINSIAYRAAPLETEESYHLHLTATAAPVLAGWHLSAQPNAIPISGTIGKAAKLQPDTYRYTYEVQP